MGPWIIGPRCLGERPQSFQGVIKPTPCKIINSMCPLLVRALWASNLTGISSSSLQTQFLASSCCFPQPSSHGFYSSCCRRGTASIPFPKPRINQVYLQPVKPSIKDSWVELQMGKEVEPGLSAQMEFAHSSPVQHKIMAITTLANFAVAAKLPARCLAYWSSENHTKDSSQPTPDIHRLRTCSFDNSAQTLGSMKCPSFIFLKLQFEFPLCEANLWGLVIEQSRLLRSQSSEQLGIFSSITRAGI